MSAPTTLEQAITAGGIRSVNFFNGRLLTGEDLSREQDANELGRLRLGRALGSGVACGLEVTEATGAATERPVLTVEPGLAVAPSGRVLELATRTDVALTRDPMTGTASPGLVFQDCSPTQPTTYTAGAGVYLLTIAPAQSREGRAPTSGLGNVDATCATAYVVAGVRFRLLAVSLPQHDVADEQYLRNRVAHRMFGSDRLAQLRGDALGARVDAWSLLDDLRDDCLGDDEVPLALLRWTAGAGLRFVDMWSVRRRVTRSAGGGNWPALVGERVLVDGEARFLQFQDELSDLLASSTSPGTTTVRDHFERLPAVGLVPLATSAALPGFHIVDFFDGVKTRDPIYIEGSIVNALVRASYAFPPVDLSSDELVWVYLVRENAQAASTAQQYLLFANGHIPYAGPARFDLVYSDFANYLLSAD